MEEPRSSPPIVAVEEEERDGVDLRDVLSVMVAGKWIILAVTASITAIAIAYAFLWPPTYSADTMIQVDQFPPGAAGAAAMQNSVLATLIPVGTMAAAEVEIMTSRSVLLPVIEKLHLDIIVNKPIPVIGKLFQSHRPPQLVVQSMQVPDRWKDTNLVLRNDGDGAYTLFSPGGRPVVHGQVGKTETAAQGRVSITVSRLEGKKGRTFKVMRLFDSEAFSDLQQNLTATQLGSSGSSLASSQSGVIQLQLEGGNQYSITKVLNEIADQYMRENIATTAEQAKKSLQFVNSQLPIVNQKFNAAQTKLAEYEEKYGVVNLDAQTQAALQQIATYESQLTQLELTRIGMSQAYKPDFPGYAAIVNQENQIKDQINKLNGQLMQIPKQQQGFVELTRDATVYGQLYQTLLTTAQDLEIQEAGTVGSARIVDHAILPYKPVWPLPIIVIAIGFVLGLIFGVVAVFLKSALARGVLDATELERDFGLPVYAIIPHSREQAKMLHKAKKSKTHRMPLLAQVDPTDPAVEALRSLRTSLNFALWESSRKIVTFGGASPGVGKSFLSVNVAHVLAAADQRVLIVDADMRKGHLHRYFGVPQEPGLSSVLSGQRSLEEVLRKDPIKNGVDFIPAGSYPPGVFELVSNVRFEKLMDECAQAYDIVVVDVPPLLAVAEGVVISRQATANFLVVKAGAQTQREIHLALERLRHNGVKLVGFVFNDLTQRAVSATFGRYAGGSYYGYKYYGEKPTEA